MNAERCVVLERRADVLRDELAKIQFELDREQRFEDLPQRFVQPRERRYHTVAEAEYGSEVGNQIVRLSWLRRLPNGDEWQGTSLAISETVLASLRDEQLLQFGMEFALRTVTKVLRDEMERRQSDTA